jgi:hypothetical protein
MAAGDGPASHPADQITHRDFMGGIAGGKAGMPRQSPSPAGRQTCDGGLQRQPGPAGRFPARMAMPARKPDHRITLQRLGQTAPVQIIVIKADEDQRNAATLPLDQGIGGQGGGQRHQRAPRADATPAPQAASTARPMPSARSPRVVSDLAAPITRSAASSTITASV